MRPGGAHPARASSSPLCGMSLSQCAGGDDRMIRLISTKLGLVIPVLFLVTLGTFFMVNLVPGDPAVEALGPNASPADYARVREQLGLNRPVVERYAHWLGGVLHGDFGKNLLPPVES